MVTVIYNNIESFYKSSFTEGPCDHQHSAVLSSSMQFLAVVVAASTRSLHEAVDVLLTRPTISRQPSRRDCERRGGAQLDLARSE